MQDEWKSRNLNTRLPIPNFIHFGVPKSGSATLSNILRLHPQVFTPRPKELNFFNQTAQYERGMDWFVEKYNSNYACEPIICDNSIGYSAGDPETTLARIVDALGWDIRILLTARHPVERAYSHYCMSRFKGQFEPMCFADAIRSALDAERFYGSSTLGCLEDQSYYGDERKMSIFRHAMYLTPGRYGKLLQLCREAVGADRVLVLFTEDMSKDLPATVCKLTEFLGVDPIDVDAGLRANEATKLRFPALRRFYNKLYSVKSVRRFVAGLGPDWRRVLRRRLLSWNYTQNDKIPPPDPEGTSLLQTYYSEDIRQFQEMTGRDLSHWLMRYPLAKADS